MERQVQSTELSSILSRRTVAICLLLAASLLACASCGSRAWGPVASSGAEIDELDVATTWVRARGISDIDISHLGRLERLERLDLFQGWGDLPQPVTATGFATLAALNLPMLRSVEIGYDDGLSDESIGAIASIRHLRVVRLVQCRGFGPQGIAAIAGMSRLEFLDLTRCKQVSDSDLRELARCGTLQSLRLAGTGVSQSGIDEFQRALPGCVVDLDDHW